MISEDGYVCYIDVTSCDNYDELSGNCISCTENHALIKGACFTCPDGSYSTDGITCIVEEC